MNGPSNVALIPKDPPGRGKQLRDLTMDALDLFKRKKFNPLQELIECFEDVKDLDSCISAKEDGIEAQISCKRLKFDIIKEIVQYGTPKLRSVEHTGQVDSGITIVLGVPPKEVKTVEMKDTNHRLPAFVAQE